MKKILLCLFWGFGAIAQQAAIAEIKGRESVFPKIIVSAAKVGQAINRDLRQEVLGLKKSVPDEKLFPKAAQADGYSIDYLGYEVLFNNRLLSLEVSGEGCAAYCEGFTRRLVYDLNTGKRLLLKDLINETALQPLCDLINRDRRERIEQHMRNLKASGQDTIAGEPLEDTQTLYESCLGLVFRPEDLDEIAFAWLGSRLMIYTERCSTHFNRAQDDLDEFALELNLQTHTDWLTPYGKLLLKP